jgi:DNA (cytosine-5)-methyltransferase 1
MAFEFQQSLIEWSCGYCEREGPAAAVLATRMGYGELDKAPIYSDVRTFPSRLYRGRVDGIIGGFPCQDLSVAGRQAGINGERSGLFFEIIRLVRELESVEWLFLENVPPVLAFPAGPTVLGELTELGFDAEWGTIRASDVGAPHRRDRAFILAYRTRRGFGELRQPSGRDGLIDGRGAAVADASDGQFPQQGRGPEGRDGVRSAGEVLGDNIECEFCGYEFDANCGRYGCPNCEGGGLADAESEGLEERGGESGHGAKRPGPERDSLPLFPPGPADLEAWREILAVRPDLAPAVESVVRRVADGSASQVDRLRACGNGVVAIQGAAAFIALARRAGMFDGELFTGGHR